MKLITACSAILSVLCVVDWNGQVLAAESIAANSRSSFTFARQLQASSSNRCDNDKYAGIVSSLSKNCGAEGESAGGADASDAASSPSSTEAIPTAESKVDGYKAANKFIQGYCSQECQATYEALLACTGTALDQDQSIPQTGAPGDATSSSSGSTADPSAVPSTTAPAADSEQLQKLFKEGTEKVSCLKDNSGKLCLSSAYEDLIAGKDDKTAVCEKACIKTMLDNAKILSNSTSQLGQGALGQLKGQIDMVIQLAQSCEFAKVEDSSSSPTETTKDQQPTSSSSGASTFISLSTRPTFFSIIVAGLVPLLF